jgi:hypothetical protein
VGGGIVTKHLKPVLSVVAVIALSILTATLASRLLPVEWQPEASSLTGLLVLLLGTAASLSQIIGFSLRDALDSEGRTAKRNIAVLLLNEIERNNRRLEGDLVKEAFQVGKNSWGLTEPLQSSEYDRFGDESAVLGYPAEVVQTLRRYYDAIAVLKAGFGSRIGSSR